MSVHNILGLIAGCAVLSMSMVATYLSLKYLRILETPLSRRLAYLAMTSSVFSIIGSLGVVVESATGLRIWWVMAAFFTLAYVTMLFAIFTYLRLLRELRGGERPRIPEFSSVPSPEESKKNPLPAGGFTIPASELPRIKPICKFATATLYVGRNTKAGGCPEFDRKIWITRIGAPDSIDPSKLHVLQGEIMRFTSEKGGGVLVILDGLEHLLLYNDFRSVMKLLSALRDYMILTGSTLIVAIEEDTLQKTQLSILRRELPPFNIDKALTDAERVALFGVISREEIEKPGNKEKKNREESAGEGTTTQGL